MGIKIRLAMLACLICAAGFSLYGAYSSIMRAAGQTLPEEVYAQFLAYEAEASYYLRPSGAYVGIYQASRSRTPISVTGIELSALRSADRALIEKGIPVADEAALLTLLEDLGS